MNSVALDFGFIQIYWYSIMLVIALLVGTWFITKEAKRFNINEEFLTNLIFYTVIIGIISARLYYVLFNFGYYSKNLFEIFEIWNGGLAIHGGIIGGCLFALFYARKYRIDIYRLFDICVVGLIIAQAIGRWGNFFNGEAYGAIVSRNSLSFLPKFIVEGMYVHGAYHQPTFFYESIWNIIVFIALCIIRRRKRYLKTGQITGLYLILYSLGRIVIEGMRTDSLMLGPIRVAQLVSVIMIIIGVILVIKRNKGSKFENLYRGEKHSEIRV